MGWGRSYVLLLVLLAVVLGSGVVSAQPKKVDPQQKRIEALEEQIRRQSQQIEEMRKAVDELRRLQKAVPVAPSPTPTPVATPTPGVIDESVPPPPAPQGPTEPETPATPTPGTIDESVPPPPAPQGPTVPETPAAPTPGGPMIDDSVPPPTQGQPTRPGGQPSQTSAPSTSSGAASASFMNPAMSVIGLFEARTSSDKSNRFDNQMSAREIELALQAPVDPFARYDVFLTAGNNEPVSVEEAYGTLFSLPMGFQAKIGKYKAAFGRNNQLHTHAFPQIDRPAVIREFFGEEGLAGAGISLSNILPLPWYSEVFLEAFSNDDNPSLFVPASSQKPTYNASWRNLFDLREDLTLEAGLSGTYGASDTSQLKDTRVAGAHMTVKYKPLRQLGQFGITWETEYLTETQRVPTTFQAAGAAAPTTTLLNRSANGWYSYLDLQASRNWFTGLRYDHTHLPFDPSKLEEGWTPYIGYRFSEFNSMRLQYSWLHRNWDKALQQVFFQWNIVIGPHGAHKY